jgi:hypothetical protein
MRAAPEAVPFFSQWETPELTEAVVAEGASIALARDPSWETSGAHSLEEYITWADNVCGMACLKMMLAAYTGRIVPTLDLARRCTEYGGYTVNEAGEIKGLIYAPFVEFVRHDFGMRAQVVTGIASEDLAGILEQADFFMASVHPAIRRPEREPPARGGHLVLVSAAREGEITFHNPSGHTPETRSNAKLSAESFGRFFAGRGIAIYGMDAA